MIIKPTTPKIYTPQDKSCVLNLDARDVRGSKIYDRSGKGNHGAITGAVIKPMNYGLPVLDLDGVDDNINCENIKFGLDDFSIEAMIKKSNHTGGQAIVAQHSFATNGFMLAMAYDFQTLLRFYGAGTDFAQTGVIVFNDIWKHIVFVRDGDNALIYVNAVLEGSGTGIGAKNFNSDSAIEIGQVNDDRKYKGQIGLVRLIKRKLSPSEISQRFNDTKNIYGI